jgi:hypothetical protein
MFEDERCSLHASRESAWNASIFVRPAFLTGKTFRNAGESEAFRGPEAPVCRSLLSRFSYQKRIEKPPVRLTS